VRISRFIRLENAHGCTSPTANPADMFVLALQLSWMARKKKKETRKGREREREKEKCGCSRDDLSHETVDINSWVTIDLTFRNHISEEECNPRNTIIRLTTCYTDTLEKHIVSCVHETAAPSRMDVRVIFCESTCLKPHPLEKLRARHGERQFNSNYAARDFLGDFFPRLTLNVIIYVSVSVQCCLKLFRSMS